MYTPIVVIYLAAVSVQMTITDSKVHSYPTLQACNERLGEIVAGVKQIQGQVPTQSVIQRAECKRG